MSDIFLKMVYIFKFYKLYWENVPQFWSIATKYPYLTGIQVAVNGYCDINYYEYLYLSQVHSDTVGVGGGGLGHAQIHTSPLPNNLYGGHKKTKSSHALTNRYMRWNSQKIQSGEPAPAIVIRISFPTTHSGPRTIWNHDEIKDLYKAIRQSALGYIPILFMALIWIDARGYRFEIWVSYFRSSNVAPYTLILYLIPPPPPPPPPPPNPR